jgi:hypothetical protein
LFQFPFVSPFYIIILDLEHLFTQQRVPTLNTCSTWFFYHEVAFV